MKDVPDGSRPLSGNLFSLPSGDSAKIGSSGDCSRPLSGNLFSLPEQKKQK